MPTDREIDGLRDRQTDKEAGRQTGRPANNICNRHSEKQDKYRSLDK